MGATDAGNGKNGDKDRKGPTGRDHDPAGTLPFATVEKDGCDDAVAQNNEQRRPDEFGEWGVYRLPT